MKEQHWLLILKTEWGQSGEEGPCGGCCSPPLPRRRSWVRDPSLCRAQTSQENRSLPRSSESLSAGVVAKHQQRSSRRTVCILMKPGLPGSLVDHALLSCEAPWRGWRQTLTFLSLGRPSTVSWWDRVCPFDSPLGALWRESGVHFRTPCPIHLYANSLCCYHIALIAGALWWVLKLDHVGPATSLLLASVVFVLPEPFTSVINVRIHLLMSQNICWGFWGDFCWMYRLIWKIHIWVILLSVLECGIYVIDLGFL